MRVLLPLKKKLDDPNSQEPLSNDESPEAVGGGELEGEAYVDSSVGLVVDNGSAGAVGESQSSKEEALTAASPQSTTNIHATTVLLSAAAARLCCLPTSPVSSDSSSSAKNSPRNEKTAAVDTTTAEFSEGLVVPPTSPPLPVRKALLLSQGNPASSDEVLSAETVEETGPKSESTVATTSTDTHSASPLGALLQVRSCGQETSSPSYTTSTTRARKRRSFSPPSGSLDQKPPSKKGRDTKPPARAKVGSSEDKKIMAGGSRGGRKIWSPSYFVETNAGREDVPNSDDTAEVDVRFNYRHENDPASARGDTRSSSVALSNNMNDVCGRDDDDVRERESSLDRPDGTLSDDDQQLFALALKKQGLEIVEQEGDGNCLFRAISLQVYGDASMHGEVRHRCLDFMARDKEHFSQFITDEPFEQYIRRKRQDGVHGNNPEIQAISELFNRPIEVFVPENGASPLNIFHAEYKTQDAPIRLSYHDGNHYNAVIDPLVPTAGLGLGLPGLQPGLADKMQMAKAVAESDRLADQREFERALKQSQDALKESQDDLLQKTLKESALSVNHMYQNKALSLSDCDATNFELEQAVLESSLESFRTFEHGRKQASNSNSANGRRKRQANSHPSSGASAGPVASAGHASSSVASIPREARQDADKIPSAAAAAAASVASAPSVASRPPSDDNRPTHAAAAPMMAEQYSQTVQELVMNGFELRKVVHAYELIGDDFDGLLSFLMSNAGS